MISPLIKWAGGKRQLLDALNHRLPDEWNTYYEPFVGGGALLVNLQNQEKITHAVIADLNRELINLYRIVKSAPEQLIDELSDEKFENTDHAFRLLKDEFNELAGGNGNRVKRAALLIYLNKHGYNGLWRVNRQGKFNVPFGRYPKRNLPHASSIIQFSRMLTNVSIMNVDFETTAKTAKYGDLIYFDPPYHPASKTAKFTDYNSHGFSFTDQERLARLVKRLSDKGVQVILSNSKVPEIEDLYQDFTMVTVPAKRSINCKGKLRAGTFEIIITNYENRAS